MTARGNLTALFIAALVLWLAAMGGVLRFNHQKNGPDDLTTLSSDVVVGKESRRYYKVYKDGVKVGYMTASQLSNRGLKVFREEVVLKINMSGKSRELFVQETSSVDSVRDALDFMTFRIQSGAHSYACNGEIHEDSLLINVKKSDFSPWRRGMFKVDRGILTATMLPYMLHHHDSSVDSLQVFDLVDFSPKLVIAAGRGAEEVLVDGVKRKLTRYDFSGESGAVVWLDSLGRMEKAENLSLYGHGLGTFSVELSHSRDVFLLPLETFLGRDTVKKYKVASDRQIKNPRSCTFMSIELDGVRAANIDLEASNKLIRSLNPVRFDIFSSAPSDEKKRIGTLAAAVADTSILGSSDYIQPKDARMSRMARSIIKADTDTLAAARALSRWVTVKMKRDDALEITRSIDLLANPVGGRDEYVKLFTALSRSIGIPTQINMGLVYEGDGFRYHSWPSVLAGGIWYDLDPWYGQDIADAARVALVRGDFECLSEYLRLVDSFTVKVLDYR